MFLPDNHPAYISWEQYQSNLHRLQPAAAAGTAPGPGAADRGVVGRLGGVRPVWLPHADALHADLALRLPAARLGLRHAAPVRVWPVSRWSSWSPSRSCEVVTPASLELSLRATAECERERAALDQQWQLRLERARQDTARAYRQYDAVEPENRLVARTLERQWEEALLAQRALEEDYARFQRDATARLDGGRACRDRDVGAATCRRSGDRRRPGWPRSVEIIRLLLERVVVWAPASSQEVTVHLHWSLGTVTEHRMTRPVRSWDQLASTAAVRQLVEAWQAAGWPSRRMAAELNAAGYQTPKGKPFTAESVRQLLARGVPGRTAGQPRQAAAAQQAASSRR